MNKTVHGVTIGVVFGVFTPLLGWFILNSKLNEVVIFEEWSWLGFFSIVLIYTVLGAIIGTILPKHK